MMDVFCALIHGLVGCVGGIRCRHDRPHPHSSKGARRLSKAKAKSRRRARAKLKRQDCE